MDAVSALVEELRRQQLSTPSLVVLGAWAALCAFVLARALAAAARAAAAAAAALRRLLPRRAAAAAELASTGSARAPATPARTPPPLGVGLKALMKGARAAGRAAAASDRVASDLFVATLAGHTDAVRGLAWSADGRALATACDDLAARVHDLAAPWASKLPFRALELRGHGGPVDVAFAGQGAHLLFALTRGRAGAAGLALLDFAPRAPGEVWSREGLFSGAATPGIRLRGSGGSAAASGGALLAAAAATPPELRVFAAAPGGGPPADLGLLHTGGMTCYGCAVSADGRFVAAPTFTADVKVWEAEFDRAGAFVALKRALDLKGHRSRVLAVAFSPEIGGARAAVTASADGTLIVWSLGVRYKEDEDAKKVLVAGLPLPKGECFSHLAWGPGGVIAAAHGSAIYFLDARTGESLEAVRGAHGGAVLDLAWCPTRVEGPQGRAALLASAGADGRARIWRAPWLPAR